MRHLLPRQLRATSSCYSPEFEGGDCGGTRQRCSGGGCSTKKAAALPLVPITGARRSRVLASKLAFHSRAISEVDDAQNVNTSP